MASMGAEEIKERLLRLLEEMKSYAPSYPLIGNVADKLKKALEKVPPEELRKALRELKDILNSA